ncbi:phosphate ABC transporter ATP-binding protein [Malaciobacter canalis]|uniref:Phosphate ABC transporter ATP-binding protein n=1 Tax=Malaciobacter canalis TaxID=1912871 RepID=A0ABX4LVJ1_9BACT|nr:ATP-binding cassette domain-containing protein [Malaciobacter canalis]PHO10358.1 phosphate ABC transporter ATP-binding protein [Malaciobacter canalis]QEE32462.1 phosphate ABC transporter, ATP-binding protein [Malaciobacter canalis]
MVIIKNLKLEFSNRVIFENLNLEIKENKITAIQGPSGIGKTSLFLCINSMIRYEDDYKLSGEILYKKNDNYINLLKLDENQAQDLRKEIIYVSQHPDLLPMSIYDNLNFFAKTHKLENKNERILEALKQVYLYDEVKDILHKSAFNLSGGQQQRLILARALLLKPKLLLLDEPTASLNESLSQKIEEMLKNQNITISIISHFKSQINNIADFCYFLEE